MKQYIAIDLGKRKAVVIKPEMLDGIDGAIYGGRLFLRP
jgi:hypothetical protein